MNIAQYIDHTLLRPNATRSEISKLCTEAKENNFKAVCINQNYISFAVQELKGSQVSICTVVGFPLGASPTEVKELEAGLAITAGATEIDMVINIAEMKNGNFDYIYKDIKALSDLCHRKNAILKVIFETCLLTKEEIIKASELSRDAGAAFIKTSTGFSTAGANLEDVALMKKTAGENVQVKASGGVRDLAALKEMIKAGATRIGTSSGVKIINGLKSDSDY